MQIVFHGEVLLLRLLGIQKRDGTSDHCEDDTASHEWPPFLVINQIYSVAILFAHRFLAPGRAHLFVTVSLRWSAGLLSRALAGSSEAHTRTRLKPDRL